MQQSEPNQIPLYHEPTLPTYLYKGAPEGCSFHPLKLTFFSLLFYFDSEPALA